MSIAEPVEQNRQSVFDGSMALPFLVLKEHALLNNLREMSEFCARNGVMLAPHCKTHMSPELWRLQESFGADRATLATVAQAEAFFESGVRRILIANEVVDPGGLTSISGMRREGLEIAVLVDSVEAVQCMTSTLTRVAMDLPALPVLIEFGAHGGRTGCRTLEEVLAVAAAAVSSGSITVVGIEGYEGVFSYLPAEARADAVDEYLNASVEVIRELLHRGLLRVPAIATFGGSRYYPAVIERVRQQLPVDEVSVILRSGCYLTHDHGTYRAAHSEIRSNVVKPSLEPALEVWGAVLSVPEDRRVIVGIGKRDVSYDEGLPEMLYLRRNDVVSAIHGATVVKLNDQHAFVDVSSLSSGPLRVGDVVAFGISHPCTTFDKWRLAPIVSDNYHIVDTIHTCFH